ncbi:DNA polymerase III subunit delta' [Dermatophilus congolensis]|uniref:DNA polymerase III subunit delta' n=1 Tax=Dermatophilus congolensis TaxID=1863 RepID=UPI001AAE2F51|nr:DNA polymerase III subunit delta' [Dermatophilus congolensis]MBO3130706.1 DNA polymerase III subunit delta' [Dermatophilus congolensis]MBO3135137.1 DNA polymerase III subunit delta' [Dermatophilus congolensis]MBO3137376.1 DNA polymerase III subunit delta' [Dermatophilus congolensis]MBO3139617.1 DNA polymerase III subunit delta' [Dermatophilus congolensis]
MTVWDDLVGQEAAVEVLKRAVVDPTAMTHAWLFTGPPGSGRSNAARAFAAALQCPNGGCGGCVECRTAIAGTHADVKVVATEGLTIQVHDARDLAHESAHLPSVGQWRIVVIEDADRLTERAADALLKAIEEPGPATVWVLCAPSLEDVIVTLRSRSRHVRLRTPPVGAVAELLVRRDGVAPVLAADAARAAQSHIGLARRLARDEGARTRRRETVKMATRIHSVADAISAAADLASIATDEAGADGGERDRREKEKLLVTLGADPAARTQPAHVRAQVNALEKEQKTRATRRNRDVIDRSLIDLQSIYRDAFVVAMGEPVSLVNEDLRSDVIALSQAVKAEWLLAAMDAIMAARERIAANVPPLLALEAMLVQLRVPALDK